MDGALPRRSSIEDFMTSRKEEDEVAEGPVSPEVHYCYFNRNLPCFISDTPRLLLLCFGHKLEFKNYAPALVNTSGSALYSSLFRCALHSLISTIHLISRSNGYSASLNHPPVYRNSISLSTNPSPLRLTVRS